MPKNAGRVTPPKTPDHEFPVSDEVSAIIVSPLQSGNMPKEQVKVDPSVEPQQAVQVRVVGQR